MGDRINYVIKEHDEFTVYYHHWRSVSLLSDLYLGEEKFVKFVKECEIQDELLSEPWIEGCVIVDMTSKQLYFWGLYCPYGTVLYYYLKKLQEQWNGWKIHHLKDHMYDVEQVLDINYVSSELIFKNDIESEFKEDQETIKEDSYFSHVVLRDTMGTYSVAAYDIFIWDIVRYGEDALQILKAKPKTQLPIKDNSDEYLFINEIEKNIIYNRSQFGLREISKNLWKGYTFTGGDYGYIDFLRIAGIEIEVEPLSEHEILEEFKKYVGHDDSFDPLDLATRISEQIGPGEFHPSFFNNPKPEE